MSSLTKDNAFIFRITHIENVPWILKNGVHCRSSHCHDPNFREIGNPELIGKRTIRSIQISPGGTLSDYVPFYFTPHSPMLLNIKTGRGVPMLPMAEIVVFVSRLHRIAELNLPFVFSDRHAYLQTARFSNRLADLDIIDWNLIASKDFKRDPERPEKVERYQAEALIYQHLPISALLGVMCYDPKSEKRVLGFQDAAGVSLKTVVKRESYFL
jgi:hypothetical protein